MTNEDSQNETKTVEIPEESKLKNHFFAYGIFKPGQLAFPMIRRFCWKLEEDDIPRTLYMRDGVPLVEGIDSEDGEITHGFKIYLNKEKKVKAYERISESQPFDLYEWNTVEIDGEEFNILIGKDRKKGGRKYTDKNRNYIDNYDGRDDPYFYQVLDFIDSELNKLPIDENDFYRLEMYYMLLWSSIDRYCSLKYPANLSMKKKRNRLANEYIFKKAFKSTDISERENPVHSTDYLFPYELERDNRFYSMNYYYTVRCNIVHRGKERSDEEIIVDLSIKELLKIFRKVIDYTFE